MHFGFKPIELSNRKCSTPFGDIDGCTMVAERCRFYGRMCSTPFGDIDGCTVQRQVGGAGPTVLNAFRRH